jgi:hypothetical protein
VCSGGSGTIVLDRQSIEHGTTIRIQRPWFASLLLESFVDLNISGEINGKLIVDPKIEPVLYIGPGEVALRRTLSLYEDYLEVDFLPQGPVSGELIVYYEF